MHIVNDSRCDVTAITEHRGQVVYMTAKRQKEAAPLSKYYGAAYVFVL